MVFRCFVARWCSSNVAVIALHACMEDGITPRFSMMRTGENVKMTLDKRMELPIVKSI
jgi:hypothetical protein